MVHPGYKGMINYCIIIIFACLQVKILNACVCGPLLEECVMLLLILLVFRVCSLNFGLVSERLLAGWP